MLKYIGVGTCVHTCDNPGVKEPDQGWLPISITVTADNLPALDTGAWRVLDKHLRAHRAAGTVPCIPIIDEASVVLKDDSGHFQWIPVSLLTP